MKIIYLKTVISALLFGEIIHNNGYGMEQNPNHNQETIIPQIIRSHQMLLPVGEVVFIPSEISKLFLYEIHDDKDIASFWATCRAWKIIGDSYYTKKNKEERIFPWKECPYLPPRILNRLNTDYRFLLGMHKNIILHNVAKSDRTRFEITCEHIQNTPLLPKKSLIKSFAELLQLHLHVAHPTFYQYNIDGAYNSGKTLTEMLHSKMAKVGIKISTIRNQEDIIFQNEIVLYFYCVSFINRRSVNTILKDSFFQKLTCNLFDAIKNHDRLLILQNTEDKTDQLWKEQIELDCAPICTDYHYSGFAHYTTGNHQKALEHYKMAIKTEQEGRADKSNLTHLLYIAVNFASLKNHQNAADYYDQFFNECLLQTKEAEDFTEFELDSLKSAALAHKELGNKDKEAYYRKRIEEIETAEALRLIEAREKEKAETEARGLAETLRKKEKAEAAEALPQTKIHKAKKGKKEKKIHNTKK